MFIAKIIAAVVFVWFLCFLWGFSNYRSNVRHAEEAAAAERFRKEQAIARKIAKDDEAKRARAERAAEAARRAEEAERRKAERHAAAMQRAEERHAQRMRHVQELAAVQDAANAHQATPSAQQTAEEPQTVEVTRDALVAPQTAQQADTVTPEAFAAQHASQTPRKASGAFAGQTVAFTGRLYGLPRAEAIKAVQARGGRAFAGMPAGTTLLVVGTLKGDGNSRKIEKADEWIGQVRKITEKQFLQMLEA